jgi:plasmid stabilization system protein ParE
VSGYAFHPDAFNDLDDLWEFIASDNIEAADRVIAEIFDAIRALVPFPHQGTAAQTSPAARCVFNSCGIT